jgi:hypothetical protein
MGAAFQLVTQLVDRKRRRRLRVDAPSRSQVLSAKIDRRGRKKGFTILIKAVFMKVFTSDLRCVMFASSPTNPGTRSKIDHGNSVGGEKCGPRK